MDTDDDEKDKGQVMGGLIGASVLGVLFWDYYSFDRFLGIG